MPTLDEQPTTAHRGVRWAKLVAALFAVVVGVILFAAPAGADEDPPRNRLDGVRSTVAADRMGRLADAATAPVTRLLTPTLEATAPVVRTTASTARPVVEAVAPVTAPVVEAVAPVTAPVVEAVAPVTAPVVGSTDLLDLSGVAPLIDATALIGVGLPVVVDPSVEVLDRVALTTGAPAVDRPAERATSPTALTGVAGRDGSQPSLLAAVGLAGPAGPVSASPVEPAAVVHTPAPDVPVVPARPMAPAPAAAGSVGPQHGGERSTTDVTFAGRAAAARADVVSTLRPADRIVPAAPTGGPPVSPD